jgi:hypothetical protein
MLLSLVVLNDRSGNPQNMGFKTLKATEGCTPYKVKSVQSFTDS